LQEFGWETRVTHHSAAIFGLAGSFAKSARFSPLLDGFRAFEFSFLLNGNLALHPSYGAILGSLQRRMGEAREAGCKNSAGKRA
jgi:hypothetical protein